MSGSIWWSTPAVPSSFFTEEEMAKSASYNRPLARAAGIRAFMRGIGLVVAQIVVLEVAVADSGSGRMLGTAVAAVAFVWWLPAFVVDAWFEYRHEPRFGSSSLSPWRFVVGSFATLALLVLLTGACAAVVAGAIDFTPAWPAVVALFVTFGFLLVQRVEPSLMERLSRTEHLSEPLDSHFDYMARSMNLVGVRFGLAETSELDGINAMASGTKKSSRVVVSAGLLETETELRDHVVAHELSHLARGHIRINAAITALLAALSVLVAGWVMASGRVMEGLGFHQGLDIRSLPSMVAVLGVVLCLFAPLLAWFRRAQERDADKTAFDLSGVPSTGSLRKLLVTDRADLAPSMAVRLLSSHPSPAERIQAACRARDSYSAYTAISVASAGDAI